MFDHHEGQRVSRRTLVRGVGALSFGGLLAACGSTTEIAAPVVSSSAGTATDLASLLAQANTCTLTPDTTQGPYYFDADKVRSDIREDKQGKLLRVAIKVQDTETCAPVKDAVVEIWHCDAGGLYSGAESSSTGAGGPGGGTPPGGMPGGGPGGMPSGTPGGAPGGQNPGGGDTADLQPTDDNRYLRGAQVTDADGLVRFTTIWPGWYRGRTVHIHAMVHVSDSRVLTTQVMFDEALNAEVFTTEPYAAHIGRDTFNDNDSIYEPPMLMKVIPDGDGYLGAIVFAADTDKDGA
jgi:protocatechuate 3,4-dioxygenase beta subunit